MPQDYSKVSIPRDLWERLKKAHSEGKFEGQGFRSPSDAVTGCVRRLVDEINAEG